MHLERFDASLGSVGRDVVVGLELAILSRRLRRQSAQAPGTCSTRRRPAGRRRPSRPPTKTTSTTWTARCRSRSEEIQGRNMWIVWTGGNDRFWDGSRSSSLGSLDFLKTLSSHPTLALRARQPLELPRPGQRAVLHGSDRARPEPLRPVARRPRSDLPARSVRRRGEVPGRRDRRPRQDRAGRLLLRRAHRHRRPAAVSQPGLRREGAQALGRRALLQRPELLRLARSGEAVPRRHVVRRSATSARIR